MPPANRGALTDTANKTRQAAILFKSGAHKALHGSFVGDIEARKNKMEGQFGRKPVAEIA